MARFVLKRMIAVVAVLFAISVLTFLIFQAIPNGDPALRLALDVLLRLFAPVLVYATEEVWSWFREGTVHRQPWPTADELSTVAALGDSSLLGTVSNALVGVRKGKSEAKVGMRSEITAMTLTAPAAQVEQLRLAEADLRATGNISGLTYGEGEALAVSDVELIPAEKRPKA